MEENLPQHPERPAAPVNGFTTAYGKNLLPLDEINGFRVRPGFYLDNGAMVIPGGVSFTIHSQSASACELLLFKREACTPYRQRPS